MIRRVRTVLGRLSRPRRRFWRYVSLRRRSVGLVFLAALAALVYLYWHLTNDRRIRSEAIAYLRNLTGTSVAIQGARFRLFGGIELRDVRVDVPGQMSKDPFFRAHRVVLKHRPWALFATGRLHVTEIVCIKPEVTVEYDAKTGQWNAMRLLDLARARRGPADSQADWELPAIHVREALLRSVEARAEAGEAYEVEVSVTMIPQGQAYLIVFEGRHDRGDSPIYGSMVLDVASGQIGGITGKVPIRRVREALPAKYRSWLERYGITGDLTVKGGPASGPRGGAVTVQLVDLAMKLPEPQGALDLNKVNGELVFYDNRVELDNITGRVAQAGGAEFRMSGNYEGYEPDSPFGIELKLLGMKLPAAGQSAGALADVLDKLHEILKPTGQMNLTLKFRRAEHGEPAFEGRAEPQGMSCELKYFPYRLEDVTGTIDFDEHDLGRLKLAARHGSGTFTIEGSSRLARRGRLDIKVSARDCQLDEQLKGALPKKFARVWDALSPSGAADGEILVKREGPDAPQCIDAEVIFRGKASAKYSGFPYPLKNLTGAVRFRGNEATFTNVAGKADQTECQINGVIGAIDTERPTVRLAIAARRVPVDDVLLAALPERGRQAVHALRASGIVESVAADVRRAAGQDLDYEVRAAFKDAKFNFSGFPYAATDAAGELVIRPDHVEIKKLSAKHGQVPIGVAGKVHILAEGFGLDLDVDATDVPLDQELFQAVPAAVQNVWKQLSPAGSGDLKVSVQQNTPDRPGELDYQVEFQAKGMQARYEDFPYQLRGLRGKVIATPGKVVLKDVTASWDQTRASLGGQILYDEKSDRAELSIRASNVPIDKELLAAMPQQITPLTSQLLPKGSLDLELKKLCLSRSPAPPATTPASTAPSQPASPPFRTTWNLDGSISFKDATINLGLDPKTLTGTIEGSAARSSKGMSLDAKIALVSLAVENRRLTDLHGRLVKGEGAFLRIDDFSAKAHGGEIAGSAMIWLKQPLDYGIRLSVREVQLGDLFNAGITDPKKKLNIEGLLEGEIQLKDSGADPAATYAAGELTITQGKLTKLPIMLDLLHLITLSPPSNATFTQGNLKYQLRGDELVFQEIYLRGPGLSLLGSGTVNMKTKILDLNFLNGPRLPRMHSVDELLEGIVRGIVGIKVTGTLEEPRPRSVPLSNLQEAIRQLYSPGQNKE